MVLPEILIPTAIIVECKNSTPIPWNNVNNSHPYLGDTLAYISMTSNCHKQNFVS